MKKIGLLSILFCFYLQAVYAQKEKTYQTKEINSQIIIDGKIEEAV